MSYKVLFYQRVDTSRAVVSARVAKTSVRLSVIPSFRHGSATTMPSIHHQSVLARVARSSIPFLPSQKNVFYSGIAFLLHLLLGINTPTSLSFLSFSFFLSLFLFSPFSLAVSLIIKLHLERERE